MIDKAPVLVAGMGSREQRDADHAFYVKQFKEWLEQFRDWELLLD